MAVATIPTVSRVTPIVEIGVGDERNADGIVAMWQPDTGTATVVSRWQAAGGSLDANSSHWVGLEPFFIEAVCHVREVTTFVGRERSDEGWEVGTCEFTVDNVGGWASYPYGGDPDQILRMEPGRQVRIGVMLDAGTAQEATHYLWGGYIDGMAPGYDVEDGEFVTFSCIDAKGEVGRAFIAELAVGVGANETATARIGRILNAVSWFNGRRSLQASAVQMRATTFGQQAVDLLDITADSSGGAVFGDVNGQVVYKARDWQAVSVSAPTDGAISNLPGDTTAVCAVSWEESFNRDDIATKVILQREGEDTPVYNHTNTAAFARYGEEPFERTDLETRFDADIVSLGDRITDVRDPKYMPRIAAVTLDAATAPNVADLMAKVSPYKPSTVECRHRGADGRTVFNKVMMVVGIEHTISPEGWTARIALDDVRPFQIGANDGRWSDGAAATGYWQPDPPTLPTPPAFVTKWSEGV